MQKISNYIFNTSPKKLAVYLVLGPLLLFLIHTVTTIFFRDFSETAVLPENIAIAIFGILFFFLAVIVLFWLFWIRSAVFFVDEAQLGLALKWFRIAYALLWVFLLFNLSASVIEFLVETQNWGDDYMYLIYASREFINFGGIIIAYPVVCHYAARAATSKRNDTSATFVNAIPFTLFLIFGTVLGVPFIHKHFSTKTSANSQIVAVYAIAFGLFVVILIIGFIAAITGMI